VDLNRTKLKTHTKGWNNNDMLRVAVIGTGFMVPFMLRTLPATPPQNW
jgi:hypothetical protein